MCVCVCVCGIDVCMSVGMFYRFTHAGKDNTLPTSIGVTEAVVLELVKGLEGRGHFVFTDNYYTSPSLASSLKQRGFGLCGTVRVNRRGIPLEIKTTKLAKGEVSIVSSHFPC